MNEELLKVLKLSETATEEEINNTVKDLIENSVKLSETVSKVEELTKTVNTLNTEKSELTVKLNEAMGKKTTVEQENIALNERVKKIEGQLMDSEWDNVYTVALNEGKIVPAMESVFKAQFIADPTGTKELISKLPVVVKLNESGSSKGKEESDEKSDMKLFEEKVNNIMLTEKLSYDEATVKVAGQEPDLYYSVRRERRCN